MHHVSARISRGNYRGERAGCRAIIERRVFGIEAHLDGMALGLRRWRIEHREIAAAPRIIHSTRSMPMTSSVTPCSTCRRVFISRKKNRSRSAS
jgi:hypothetical protein